MKEIFKSSLWNRLIEFRLLTQKKTLDCEGLRWSYLIAGDGEHTLMLLPGGLGTAEPWFDCMMDWAREFRVIAINYPQLESIETATKGITAIVEAEGGAEVTLLGTSLGGEIAQAMLKNLPHAIRKVILGNTGVADRAYGEKLKKKLPVLKLFRMRIAFALLRVAALSRMVSLLKPYLSREALEFWKKYAAKIVEQDYSPQSMQTQFDLLIDFALHYAAKAGEKQSVAMLIVESEDDLYFKAESRAKLRALYPEAEVRSFKSGGHLLAITKRDEYVELVAEFVRE